MNKKEMPGTHDKYSIKVHDKYEVEYWSTKFGVSAEELLSAVEAVGHSSIDVKEHIRRKL